MIEGILIGLETALSFKNLLMVMMGCFFGTIIGMLPGLGPMTAIALMIPITYGFEPATGLILMAGVYYGAVFGGSTSSILKSRNTIDKFGKNTSISVKGRHDPCVGIRAVPIGEAMLNCVLLDHYLLNKAQCGN